MALTSADSRPVAHLLLAQCPRTLPFALPIYDHDHQKLVYRTASLRPTTLHTALRPPLYRGADARESTPLGLRARIRVGDATLEDKYRNTTVK